MLRSCLNTNFFNSYQLKATPTHQLEDPSQYLYGQTTNFTGECDILPPFCEQKLNQNQVERKNGGSIR